MTFSLHPQLEKDSISLGCLPLCEVRLINNRLHPWLLLIPQLADIREIHELPESQQQLLMQEITNVSWVMQSFFKADKMNVAALGNQVPQLHVHIIARYMGDAAWPRPVWGVNPAEPYNNRERDILAGKLREALKLA